MKASETIDPGMTGGSIITLVNLYYNSGLLTKHEHECGWNEIKSDRLCFQTSSSILLSVYSIGYMFGKSLQGAKSECDQDEHLFPSEM